MKIRVTLKDPDGVFDSVEDGIDDSVNAIPGIAESERDAFAAVRKRQVREKLGRWIEHGEYISIDFDLDAGTATVREVKRG